MYHLYPMHIETFELIDEVEDVSFETIEAMTKYVTDAYEEHVVVREGDVIKVYDQGELFRIFKVSNA